MISVCMATYNGEKYIMQQINSILKQLDASDELIISDDGSNDKTINFIKSINDERIKLIFNTGTHGFVKNFENSIKHAKGDYIFLSDQDDIWLDSKVSKCMQKFNDGYNFVYTDCYIVDEYLNILFNSRIDEAKIKKGFLNVLLKNRYLGCCMAFDRKVLKTILPFPKKTNLIEHDTWIALISNKMFKCCILKEPLMFYRRHSSNFSDGGFKNNKNLFQIIYKRIYRFFSVFKRKYRS